MLYDVIRSQTPTVAGRQRDRDRAWLQAERDAAWRNWERGQVGRAWRAGGSGGEEESEGSSGKEGEDDDDEETLEERLHRAALEVLTGKSVRFVCLLVDCDQCVDCLFTFFVV